MKKLTQLLLIMLVTLAVTAMASNQKLTVMLDWFPNPNHAPLFVAQEQGFFAQQGLDVKLITPGDGADPSRFAAMGKVDLALTYEPQWLVQQQQGLPLTWVATLVNQPLSVIVLDNSQVKTLSDLKGKAIGYSEGAISGAFLKSTLAKAKLSQQDIKLVNVHYDLVQSLLAHRVAAISGVMRNVEPQELKAKNFPYTIVVPQQYGVPSYAELIFVAQQGRESDPRFKAFAKAIKEAVVYLKAHPEDAWQQFVKHNPGLNNEINHQIWLSTVEYFTLHPDYFDKDRYATLKTFLQAQNVLHN